MCQRNSGNWCNSCHETIKTDDEHYFENAWCKVCNHPFCMNCAIDALDGQKPTEYGTVSDKSFGLVFTCRNCKQ